MIGFEEPKAGEYASRSVPQTAIETDAPLAHSNGDEDSGSETSWLKRGVIPGVWLMVWAYLYLTALLLLWTVLASVATGWSPVVITENSMQPTISPGDVLLVEDPTGVALGQRAVVTYEQPVGSGHYVTHRITAVEPDGLRTRGDANTTPDIDLVNPSQVVGVTRMVVPYVGLPAVWWANEAYLPFASWLVLTICACLLALNQQKKSDKLSREPSPPIAQKAIRRVRVLVAILIAAQFVIDPSRLDFVGPGGRLAVLIMSVAALSATNVMSSIAETEQRFRGFLDRVPVLELVLDSLLVLALTTATGTNGIGWVLFALPIIEAATRFRLTGALLHWMMLTGATLTLQIMVLQGSDTPGAYLLGSLEQVLDQLSVLLLVVLPGAYLAEQLMSEVAMQRSSAGEAADRSQLLQNVVESSEDVNRLGLDVAQGLVDAVLKLGFEVAEVNKYHATAGYWETVAAASTLSYLHLPVAGQPGSCLSRDEMQEERVVVDLRDESNHETSALIDHGLSSVVRMNWPQPSGEVAVVRVGCGTGTEIRSSQLEAMMLLVSQAVVATQNDKLVNELQEMHDQISIQANQDSLTGLPNRLAFMRDLSSAIEAGQELSILFMDLNGFKAVNDRMGHDVGDEVLIAVAQRLGPVVADYGTLCRLGGDEFTILMNGLAPGGALRLAEAVTASIAQPFDVAGEQINLGIAVGIAISELELPFSEVLRRADLAMYNAKATGGRSIAFYTPQMEDKENRKTLMQTGIGSAILDESQVELHYQPIIHARTRQVAGMEALLRWEHPELGQISPGDAILVAQQSGVADELTKRVLKLALAECKRWQTDLPNAPAYVAVNVSPFELESETLVRNVGMALAEFDLPARHLKIELSEKILGPEEGSYRDNIDGLRKLGVVVTLDDFGEGRTSLAHLRGLPIEGLKLDRSLITNSIRSESDRIILDSITKLAHGLKFEVVAEGVETPEHLVRVLAAGCDYVQGYLFSRPLQADDIPEFLDKMKAGEVKATDYSAEVPDWFGSQAEARVSKMVPFDRGSEAANVPQA